MTEGLTRDTKVGLGAAGAVIVTVLGAAFWIQAQFTAVRKDLSDVRLEIARSYASKDAVSDLSKGHTALSVRVATLEARMESRKK